MKDNKYYQDLILQAIEQHNSLDRSDIDELLITKLPEWMNEYQKKIKVNNLIADLRSKNKIKNEGSDYKSKWIIVNQIN